jgi:hypothetical protein
MSCKCIATPSCNDNELIWAVGAASEGSNGPSSAEDRFAEGAAEFPTGFKSLKRFKEGEMAEDKVGCEEAGPSIRGRDTLGLIDTESNFFCHLALTRVIILTI